LVKVLKSVTVDVEVGAFLERNPQINASGAFNDLVLEMMRRAGEVEPDGGAHKERLARSERLVSAIQATAARREDAVNEALSRLQKDWNLHRANAPNMTLTSKLDWVGAKAYRYRELQAMKPAEILAELEGTV